MLNRVALYNPGNTERHEENEHQRQVGRRNRRAGSWPRAVPQLPTPLALSATRTEQTQNRRRKALASIGSPLLSQPLRFSTSFLAQQIHGARQAGECQYANP